MALVWGNHMVVQYTDFSLQLLWKWQQLTKLKQGVFLLEEANTISAHVKLTKVWGNNIKWPRLYVWYLANHHLFLVSNTLETSLWMGYVSCDKMQCSGKPATYLTYQTILFIILSDVSFTSSSFANRSLKYTYEHNPDNMIHVSLKHDQCNFIAIYQYFW